MKQLYAVTRDLHLYLGLFISPAVLVFAVSVFFLVHAWIPGGSRQSVSRIAGDLPVPAGVELMSGRDQANALRGVLDSVGVKGEITYIRRIPEEHRLVIPVAVPGREVVVDLNTETRSATITGRGDSVWRGLVYLHKMPGPHNANIRGNWVFLRIWKWLADATVYLVLFLSVSGIYLWAVLRAERRMGWTLIGAGACTFFGLVYALVH
jgi:hypothetical protein